MIKLINGQRINPAQITTVTPTIELVNIKIELRHDSLLGETRLAAFPQNGAAMVVGVKGTLSCGTQFEETIATFDGKSDQMEAALAFVTARLPRERVSGSEGSRIMSGLLQDFRATSQIVDDEVTKWLS